MSPSVASCDEKVGMLVRDEAQKVGRLSYANGGELLCRELVRNCRNQYGLQLALEIGALNDKENVSILIRRIQLMDKAQGKQNSRESEMLDTTDNLPTNLLRAIYENAMNIRNNMIIYGMQVGNRRRKSWSRNRAKKFVLRCSPRRSISSNFTSMRYLRV